MYLAVGSMRDGFHGYDSGYTRSSGWRWVSSCVVPTASWPVNPEDSYCKPTSLGELDSGSSSDDDESDDVISRADSLSETILAFGETGWETACRDEPVARVSVRP